MTQNLNFANPKAVVILSRIIEDYTRLYPTLSEKSIIDLVKHIVECINREHITVKEDVQFAEIRIEEVPNIMCDNDVAELVQRVTDMMFEVVTETRH